MDNSTTVDDYDIENARENFAIQNSLIFMKLEEILKRTKDLEKYLIQEIRSQVSTTDFYKSSLENDNDESPKKRRKIEK